jgi:hypothetical protein
LTDVTASYFNKLVTQLEKGFADLEKDFAGKYETLCLTLLSFSTTCRSRTCRSS